MSQAERPSLTDRGDAPGGVPPEWPKVLDQVEIAIMAGESFSPPDGPVPEEFSERLRELAALGRHRELELRAASDRAQRELRSLNLTRQNRSRQSGWAESKRGAEHLFSL